MAWYITLAILLIIVIVLVILLSRKSASADEALRQQYQAETDLAAARTETVLSQSRLSELSGEIQILRNALEESKREAEKARIDVATVTEEREGLKRQLDELVKAAEQQKEELRKDFSLIAEKVIEEKSNKVTDKQREDLKAILNPLQEKIEAFKKQVAESYDTEAKERHTLAHIIKQLSEQSTALSNEANALSEALRGQSKVQGDWGELILDRILEDSGLTRGREYELQEYITDKYGNKLTNEDTHQRMRPDAIIHFPRERDVIIDAKVSLTAYTEFHEATTEEARRSALDRHLLSVRSHIEDLHKRDYSGYLEGSPDFVIMFFPNEGAYNLAVHGQSDLWQTAYKKKVLLMGPANLIGMLKILYDLWSKEMQLQNIEKIIDSANKMYEKFVNFSDNFTNIGKKLEEAQKTYEQARGQLSSGRGNLIRQMEGMRSLGLRSSKRISASLLNEAKPDEDDDDAEE
ncbi:DNA recombination protein RmuC [Porphyromonas sp.]|uniref:DNA recombination protein RmuC n=1 Tax=Porphyromonas sp. TaxID=1924944 RepID=UPI0026DB9CEA|nr:DNA recombination protein RmuC [Porphyromonas sp.]MDO4771602.1 DNA recombination protein RmuC [Porphyromonas sp.]